MTQMHLFVLLGGFLHFFVFAIGGLRWGLPTLIFGFTIGANMITYSILAGIAIAAKICLDVLGFAKICKDFQGRAPSCWGWLGCARICTYFMGLSLICWGWLGFA